MSTPQPGDDSYIRTFAKDMALAQGKPASATPVQKEESKGGGVDADRQAVLDRLKSRAKEQPQQSQVSRSTMLPSELPTPVKEPEVKDAPVTVPSPPQQTEVHSWKPGDLPTYAPQAPIPNVVQEPSVQETPVPSPPKAPEPVAPPPQPLKTPEPVAPPPSSAPRVAPPHQAYREAIPERIELPTVAPRIEQRPVAQEPLPPPPIARTDEPSPIHTFSSDFSNQIDTQRASTFSVLAAQSDAGTRIPATAQGKKSSVSRRNLLFVALGVVLVALAGGASYGAYRYITGKSIVPLQPTTPSLIFADERVDVSGEGSQLQQSLLSQIDSSLPEGGVRVFFLSVASSTPLGEVKVELPGGNLIGALQLNAPDILMRNIGPDSTVGAVNADGQQKLFMIFQVLSYERTFAGMLNWEPTMVSHLSAFYPEYPAPPLPPPTIATTTKIVKGKTVIATTTVQAEAPPYSPPAFIDEVSANRNVRALKDSYGNTIFLYGYVDKSTLVLARDEAAFVKIVERISATKSQ